MEFDSGDQYRTQRGSAGFLRLLNTEELKSLL